MSHTPVPVCPRNTRSIRRWRSVAAYRRHDSSSDSKTAGRLDSRPRACQLLSTCQVDIPQLGRDLEEVLTRSFTPVPEKTVKPESTIGFDRVVERPLVHAASCPAPSRWTAARSCSCCRRKTVTAACASRVSIAWRCCACRWRRAAGLPRRGEPGEESGPRDVRSRCLPPISWTARPAARFIRPIGREIEIERMVQALCRRRKNNPLLVGEPGVGKHLRRPKASRSASTRATCRKRCSTPRVRARFRGLALLPAPATAAISKSASRRCSIGLSKEHNAILFIDEIHTLIGAGSASGGDDERRATCSSRRWPMRFPPHRFDDVRRRQAVVRQGPRAVAPLPED